MTSSSNSSMPQSVWWTTNHSRVFLAITHIFDQPQRPL